MASPPRIPASGRITRGITPNRLITQTIAFVEKQLPAWRDDRTRKSAQAEEELNGQLCKFLADRARDGFPMTVFHHEERQGRHRRADFSANPSSKAIAAAVYDSIYEPFLVMEGKRLPTPTAARKREYLTGLTKLSGGIQRYRLCLHGKGHLVAVLIGYVQKGGVTDWHKTINGWIDDLKTSREDAGLEWTEKDALGTLKNTGENKACRCESNHSRTDGAADIRLIHLWICMPPKKSKKTN
jgi:hypothetical protein